MAFVKGLPGVDFQSVEQALLSDLERRGLAAQLRRWEGGWELVSPVDGERPVRLDFARESAALRPTLRSLKSQPLFRALGSKGGVRPRVWDVACGLGGDALMLLLFGCEVVSTERHPVPALMLLRAYEAWSDPLKGQWQLLLQGEPPRPSSSDVIYFDPMYGGEESSALPRKEMRIFRSLVGEDTDALEVGGRLRGLGCRLIVKRPPKAPPLMSGAAFAQEGKAVRFDVYLP